jgi:hypothetical protein
LGCVLLPRNDVDVPRNELSVLRSEIVPVERLAVRPREVLAVTDEREVTAPLDSSEGVVVVRVVVVRVVVPREGETARLVVAPRASRELPLAREIVGTPLEVVRLGAGR